MPNLNVCTGPAFGTGPKNELEPANVRPVVWPYSSNPTTAAAQMQTANGLRYDQTTATPGGGLWVPQVVPTAATVVQTGAPATSVPVSASLTSVAGIANVPFTNPSSVATMAVLATITWRCGIGNTSGQSTWMEMWTSVTAGSATIPLDATDSSGAGSFNFDPAYTESLAFNVGPAATVQLIPTLGVKNVAGSGSFTLNTWRLVVSSVTFLLDPTTPG